MEKKYCIDTKENQKFLAEMREELLDFGRDFASPGGSSYYLGDDGTPWKTRSRETWITSRMAHVYSIGAIFGHAGSERLAAAAIRGLNGELSDQVSGGWYAGVTADGQILPGKQSYAHAFVILAATSSVLAGVPGAKDLLDRALKIYDLYFWNESEGMACDSWDTGFLAADDYRGLNANMHTVEAFLAVADVTGNETYRVRCGRIIDRVIGWAAVNDWRIPEHFTKDWQVDLECSKDCPNDQFKPYGATPGHGLEWARLIIQWALSSDRCGQYLPAAEQLFGRAVADGWYVDGAPGFVYTTDWQGKPVVADRMHWTLAEAINTAAVLYRVTKNQKYADFYCQWMMYLDEKVLDHVNHSWFHQLDAHNRVIDTVWPGKPDIYHALQATLIPYYDSGVSIALAVKQKLTK